MHITLFLASGQGLIGVMFVGIAIVVCIINGGTMCRSKDLAERKKGERIFFVGLFLLVLSFFLFPLFLKWL